MHSILKLYYDEFLTPSNNYRIESIEDYLDNASVDVRYEFQYQKHELNKTIKVNISQDHIDNENTGYILDNFNYCSIQNVKDGDAQRIYYYFIVGKHWRSQSTIELDLQMDVLNTFEPFEDYYFSDKTLIHRQHKDRFRRLGALLVELYHPYPEGINPPLFTNMNGETVSLSNLDYDPSETSAEGRNWYLMYRTDYEGNDVVQNPISTYLFSDERLPLGTGGLSQLTLSASQFSSSNAYLVVFGNGFANASQVNINGTMYTLSSSKRYYLLLSYDGDLKGALYESNDGTYASSIFNNRKITSITFYQNTPYYTSSARGTTQYTIIHNIALGYATIQGVYDVLAFEGIYKSETQVALNIKTYNEILCLSDIDRTDSRINKIVMLPSCPIKASFDASTNVFYYNSSDATYVNGLLKINPNAEFLTELKTTAPFTTEIVSPDDFNTNRYIIDPKLKTSEFRYDKYYYDSFSFIFKAENIAENEKLSTTLPITFKASHLFNSRFLYKFGNQSGNAETNQHIEDYPNLLLIDRNNEITVYNNEYIQYMKNGYNYAVKSKNLEMQKGFANIISSSIIGGIAKGNPLLSASSVLNGINSIKNIYFQSISMQLNIDRTIGEAQLQSTNVNGADDMDLLLYYNGNKLKHKVYECSSKMKALLDDMFYYLGYIDNTQEVPNIHSRKWFNYVECDPVFTNRAFTAEIEEKLKALYKGGVTFFHYNNGEWDISQSKENFEVSVIN